MAPAHSNWKTASAPPRILRDRRRRRESITSADGKAIHRRYLDIRLLFAYSVFMFQGPANRKMFVVTCKRCRRDIPAGVSEFPFQSITVVCCLCGEPRRYLPSELFLGKVDHLVLHQNRRPR